MRHYLNVTETHGPACFIVRGSADVSRRGSWVTTDGAPVDPTVPKAKTPEIAQRANVKPENKPARVLSACHNMKDTFILWRKNARNGNKIIAGVVHKNNTGVYYRLATDNNGLGALHKIKRYSKRVPIDVWREIVGAGAGVTVYLQPVAEYVHNVQYHNARETGASGPHDRKPQKMMLDARKAW